MTPKELGKLMVDASQFLPEVTISGKMPFNGPLSIMSLTLKREDLYQAGKALTQDHSTDFVEGQAHAKSAILFAMADHHTNLEARQRAAIDNKAWADTMRFEAMMLDNRAMRQIIAHMPPDQTKPSRETVEQRYRRWHNEG